MTTIVTRAAKGSRLTWGEVDANFTNLNADKVETINPTSSGTLTHSGDIVLSGSGKRITGDFSNATVANRLMFQTSVVNGATEICAVPSGAGQQASIVMLGNSSGANCSILRGLVFDGSETSLRSTIDGVGSYVPMTFYTGGSERMRIDTAGVVSIATVGASGAILSLNGAASGNEGGELRLSGSTGFQMWSVDSFGNDLRFTNTGGVGNVLVHSPSGLGYGTGAGGVVTQATSKSTAVTLNKPTGQITMNNAALAAGASVTFFCNCSVVGAYDAIQANIVATQYSNYSIKSACDSGHIYFILTNTSAGSLSDAVQIQFAIIKGAVS